MATISWVIFKHHKKADGTYNPKIRITHNRTTVYMATQIFTPLVRFKRGETTGTVTDGAIEDSLNDKVKDMRKIINMYDYIIDECENAKSVLTFIDRKMNENKDLDFIAFAEGHIKTLSDNGSKRLASSLLANLKYYINGDNLPVKRITSFFLVRFEAWLRTSRQITLHGKTRHKPPIKDSSIQTYMQTMQSIYNRMLLQYNDYELGDIIIPGDPFKRYTPPKAAPFKKKAVDASIIRKVADYDPSTKRWSKKLQCVKDMFLLSFCLAGMNPIDMFTCDTYQNGRIDYCRTKTRNKKKDSAFISVPIPKEIKAIFNKYRDNEGKRVFCFYKLFPDIIDMRCSIAYCMKVICTELEIEPMTFYAARHSFATIARNECNVSMDDIALCLTHVSGHSITDTYVKPDFSRVDRVIRKVIEYVFGGK